MPCRSISVAQLCESVQKQLSATVILSLCLRPLMGMARCHLISWLRSRSLEMLLLNGRAVIHYIVPCDPTLASRNLCFVGLATSSRNKEFLFLLEIFAILLPDQRNTTHHITFGHPTPSSSCMRLMSEQVLVSVNRCMSPVSLVYEAHIRGCQSVSSRPKLVQNALLISTGEHDSSPSRVDDSSRAAEHHKTKSESQGTAQRNSSASGTSSSAPGSNVASVSDMPMPGMQSPRQAATGSALSVFMSPLGKAVGNNRGRQFCS